MNQRCRTPCAALTLRLSPRSSDAVLGERTFAGPVRREIEVRLVYGHLGHALAPPAREIRNENVSAEVELRLVEDDPSPGTPAPTIERAAQFAPEPCRRPRVPRSGARVLASEIIVGAELDAGVQVARGAFEGIKTLGPRYLSRRRRQMLRRRPPMSGTLHRS